VRIYSEPQWVRAEGASWLPLADAVKVSRDGAGYLVAMDRDRWVKILPAGLNDASALVASTQRDVQTDRHFGPVLNAATAPHDLRFRVICGPACQWNGAGYVFADVEGAPGLYLRQWEALLGQSLAHDTRTGEIALDLREVKAAAANGEIDLDPEIAATSGYRYYDADSTWSAVRNAASGLVSAIVYIAVANSGDTTYTIRRASVRFDTLGYNAASATLRLTEYSPGTADPYALVADLANPAQNASYGQVKTTGLDVPGNLIGLMTESPTGVWSTGDLVASGHYAQDATFDLAITTYQDYSNTAPTTGLSQSHSFVASGEDGPCLELTLVPSAAHFYANQTHCGHKP